MAVLPIYSAKMFQPGTDVVAQNIRYEKVTGLLPELPVPALFMHKPSRDLWFQYRT